MQYTLNDGKSRKWQVNKIGVIGPGIVGMPMAAMLAHAQIRIGSDKPAKVTIIQRDSVNSGWKVAAVNSGKSVIGGIEPELDDIVKTSVDKGLLQASSDYDQLSDADVVLVSIQTDKTGWRPDYGPMFGGLTDLAKALLKRPAGKTPLIVFESTLAPSSMITEISDHFKSFGLIEGRDILLGNSPNRVMPGRLIERIRQSDKLVAGLHPDTPKLIAHLYRHIVTEGKLYQTNSLTAEVVKTLENAYRDVRIAFSTEVAHYCDTHDIDFYTVREKVNTRLDQTDNANFDANCVPSGGLLIPTVGVGGHCLPKDGILLWWRRIEAGHDMTKSLIIGARAINDSSPQQTIALMEKVWGNIDKTTIAIMGTAYRFNSEDTRNSPSIQLALRLQERGCRVTLHDPYVKPNDQNILKYEVENIFTNDLDRALKDADFVIYATAHHQYQGHPELFATRSDKSLRGVVDGCNLFQGDAFTQKGIDYTGIGRGRNTPHDDLIDYVIKSFTAMERGVANEVKATCSFLNERYAKNSFDRIDFAEVQRLAGSCSTGCAIADSGPIENIGTYDGFCSHLTEIANLAFARP
jgi:UDP-N-acetyl-D-mannosaminuronic acid dehydrogenase